MSTSATDAAQQQQLPSDDNRNTNAARPTVDNKTAAAAEAAAAAAATATTSGAAPAAASTPASSSAAASRLPLELRVVPEHSKLPVLEVGATSMNVLIEVKSGAPAQGTGAARNPLNLILVLDRSGSMGGARMRSLQAAATQIIESLLDCDYVTVIAYDTEAQVVASGKAATDKNRILDSISSLRANNSTNMEEALKLAINVVQKTAAVVPGAATRVFLVSDGEPTVGDCSHEGLGKLAESLSDTPLSTFGIGVDIEPALLQSTANAGCGKYFFVSERRVQEVIGKAFDDLSRLMLSRCQLSLKCESGMKFAADAELNGAGCDVNDFRYNSTTRFLTKVSTENLEVGKDGGMVVFLRAEFLGLLPDQPLAPPVVVTALGQLQIDVDPTATRSEKDRTVDVLVALKNAGASLDKIDGLLEKNDVNSAISLLNEICSTLKYHVDQDNDIDGLPHVLLRRSQRTLERLQAQGVHGARRARLDLGAQATQLRDRVSCCDFASSESSNRSGNFAVQPARRSSLLGNGSPAGARGGIATPPRSGISSGSDDDDSSAADDTDDNDDTSVNTPSRRGRAPFTMQPADTDDSILS